jgi:kynurenine formamidase
VSEPRELPTNWGRWGDDDQRGTLNLITGQVRAQAVAEARTGRTVSLSRPIPMAPLAAGPMAAGGADTTAVLQAALYTGAAPRALAELVVMMTHSPEVTHFDSLAHQVVDGRVYPGVALEEAGGPAGVRHGSTAIFEHGVLTRGVLLDLAADGPLPEGHGVTGADLESACDRGRVQVRSGDAIVVRGGWDYVTSRHRRLPGMTLDAVSWMHRHDVAVYTGDIGDAHPPIDPRVPGPLHRVGLALLGMPLIDVSDPAELAAACAEEGRYSFLFVAAPPRLSAASGVPVNPLAIF